MKTCLKTYTDLIYFWDAYSKKMSPSLFYHVLFSQNQRPDELN